MDEYFSFYILNSQKISLFVLVKINFFLEISLSELKILDF